MFAAGSLNASPGSRSASSFVHLNESHSPSHVVVFGGARIRVRAAGAQSEGEGSQPTCAASVLAVASLAPSLEVVVGDEVRFAFEVTNVGKNKRELTFADGRTHDVSVRDSLGREVWRGSDGRIFTQSMQSRVLRARDQLRYEEAWDARAPGGLRRGGDAREEQLSSISAGGVYGGIKEDSRKKVGARRSRVAGRRGGSCGFAFSVRRRPRKALAPLPSLPTTPPFSITFPVAVE